LDQSIIIDLNEIPRKQRLFFDWALI